MSSAHRHEHGNPALTPPHMMKSQTLRERSHSAEADASLAAHDATAALIVTSQATTGIEPDSDFVDDGYEDGNLSEGSMSIEESVRDYAFENGRRYHRFREGRYVFPNDELEQLREDMKHAMIVNLCGGKLHFAPIGEHPQNIIDLGTGTGIWCIDSRFNKTRRPGRETDVK
jgi:hypothetical protein